MTSGAPGFDRLLLIGFMGSGKSTVGPLVSHRLGWTFLDMDDEIERGEGRSIPEIFAESGEPGFREIESRTAAKLLRRSGVVVATGGGWPTVADNWGRLPESSVTVWLDVSPETAARRVLEDETGRPLLASEDPIGEARTLMDARREAYRRADHRIDAERGSPAEIAERIESLVTDRDNGIER